MASFPGLGPGPCEGGECGLGNKPARGHSSLVLTVVETRCFKFLVTLKPLRQWTVTWNCEGGNPFSVEVSFVGVLEHSLWKGD